MRKIRRWGPGLLLVSPSIVLVAVFVYGLIGWNVKVSLSDWRQAEQTSGFDTSAYRELFPDRIGETGAFVRAVVTGDQPETLNTDPAWIIDVHHALLFTVAFVLGALIVGGSLAFLLDKGVKGEGMFRAIYLFPMAVSFIVTGVVWRWLLAPRAGVNILPTKVGMEPLDYGWYTDPKVVYVHDTSRLGEALEFIGLGFLADPNFAITMEPGTGWAAESGELAVTTATGSLTRTDASGAAVTVPISNQTVWRREDGVGWKIVSEQNTALPQPAAGG